MATTKFPNRNGDVGRGNPVRGVSDMGSTSAGDDSKWLLYAMLFFALIAFLTLPVSVMILMDSKKTNANSHAALAETKKIQAELKPKKKEGNDE